MPGGYRKRKSVCHGMKTEEMVEVDFLDVGFGWIYGEFGCWWGTVVIL